MAEVPTNLVHTDAILILSITTPQVRGDQVAEEIDTEFNAALDRSGPARSSSISRGSNS